MKVRDLIAHLEKFPADQEVMVLDSFNGGGLPREINLGPVTQRITQEHADECADCEEREGEEVVVLGWGCY